jgi:hypothetical protein
MQNNSLYNQIRQILLTDWDPIGICDVRQAQDEYDDYVGRIAEMLTNSRSIAETSEYLLHVETNVLGLPGNRERARAVAAKLSNVAQFR